MVENQSQKPQNEADSKINSDYSKQEWYTKLSPDQQKVIDSKFEQQKDLEKKVSDKKSEIRFK
jgi:hypothetical protein